jgi:hypothetical protein
MLFMDIYDTSAVIRLLNKAAGADETWRVETFQMHRESPTHGFQEVTVEVLDRGPEISPRYHLSAKTADGKSCSGNSGDDLEVVLGLAHWYQLDK